MLASWSPSTVGVLGLALVAAGVTGGLVFGPGPAPSSLLAPILVASAPVSLEPFDDSTDVDLQVDQGQPRQVVAAISGTVTALWCLPGRPVASGGPVLAVDGQPVVALATAVPLWRDLSVGIKGDDVAAVQKELGRLGHQVPHTGVYDRATRLAMAKVLSSAGATLPADGQLPRSRVVWLPASNVPVASCDVTLGAPISAGGSVVTVPAAITKISVKSLPSNAAPGPRNLVMAGVRVAADANGAVTDPKSLAKLTASPLYQAFVSSKGAVPLRGSWVLAAPLQVAAVPPSSLIGLDATVSCVQTDTATVPVTVVSSMAGRSLVAFPAGTTPPRTVRVQPGTGTRCG